MTKPNRAFKLPGVWLWMVVLLALGGSQLLLNAADHADSPDTAEGNLDVNDLYVFNKGADSLVMVMTVAPLLAPGQTTDDAALNPNGLYQFKLDVERDGIEEAVIQIAAIGAGPTQTIDVRGPVTPESTGATANTLVDTTSVQGDFNTTFSGEGMTVFVGPRDDPFYINLFGDESLTSVLNAAYGAALGTQVGDSAEQSLSFEDPAADDLAGVNTLAIVIQMSKAELAAALGIAADGVFYAWATTSDAG